MTLRKRGSKNGGKDIRVKSWPLAGSCKVGVLRNSDFVSG